MEDIFLTFINIVSISWAHSIILWGTHTLLVALQMERKELSAFMLCVYSAIVYVIIKF